MQPAHLAAAQPPLHAAVEERQAGASQPRPLLAFSAKGCTHSLKLRESFKLGPQLQLELGADLVFPGGGALGSSGPSSSRNSIAGGATNTSSTATDPANASSNADISGSVTNSKRIDSPGVLPARVPLATAEGLHFTWPWVALQWQADPEDRGKGVLRADAHHVSYSRSIQLGRKGDWWAVRLDAKLGLTYSGQPHMSLGTSNLPLSLSVAAALLVAGKPVHLAHLEAGGLAVHFPLSFGGTRHKECLSEKVEMDLEMRRQGRSLVCKLHQLNGVVRLREE
ncbi:DDT domain-containing [Chlorella sorokiniana]|uniref:DDT domain-containing n=1 Tax=Chlorella sorokiniana TaxID=3076 RepID=A0A2P6TPW7_CHLSO|nr:DDT domain-containing [Chlorella sorokiniana]|eukprot:PRW56071.1 DDT domain-containing [Chlorella sorokiniana]